MEKFFICGKDGQTNLERFLATTFFQINQIPLQTIAELPERRRVDTHQFRSWQVTSIELQEQGTGNAGFVKGSLTTFSLCGSSE